MAFIELAEKQNGEKLVMIFAEGTVLKPKSIFSLYNHNDYVPIGKAVELIRGWQAQGAEIVYCTSRKNRQAQEIACLLQQFGFVGTRLYYRDKKQKYKDIVESVMPDILIEDDCRSIGGSWQMCITNVEPRKKEHIESVAVKEFKGIDHLPTDFSKI